MPKKVIFLLLILVGGGVAAYYYRNTTGLSDYVNAAINYFSQQNTADDSIALDLPGHKQVKHAHSSHKRTPKKLKPDEFTVLDDFARNTPPVYEKDIPTLAKYLLIPPTTDVEKARVLFTWVATHISYDDDAINTGHYGDCTATGVLKSKKTVCAGYSALFEKLGTAMGLQVEQINGYSKAYGYTPGQHFTKTDHAWNAVKLNGHWRPCDVTWGSSNGETKSGLLVTTSRFEPYWFNVDPREFIFTHFPEDKNWELIPIKISLEQYEEMPLLDEGFFKLGYDPGFITGIAMKGNADFFDTYSSDWPFKAIQLPFYKKLNRKAPVEIIIESDYADDMEAIDGSTWKPFSHNANKFNLILAPGADSVKIVYKINSFDEGYTTLVKYSAAGNNDVP